ncbi:MAG TPA: carboxylesterase family protein [Ohtaekwangia sp.]|nr:carboxylesterase family protein [Ohtaekwangia sp.]
MKNIAIAFFVICCFSCSNKEQVVSGDFPIVKTKTGLIRGVSSNGIQIFKGIPYAAPPVNDLRWKVPKPVSPWSDTLMCTAYAASPIQNPPEPFRMWTQEFIAPATPLSEDCLYLNIWTPGNIEKEKLPVLVWIHGGAFLSGAASCPVYDGEAMARKGIVFVSINYRLGIFGFMAHPDLTAESENKSSGNYGLLDQIQALRWVKENVSAFGGDPEKVTIAGQSAGSMSVQLLVASPLTKNLLHGAIAQSGASANGPSMTLREAEEIGQSIAEKASVSTIDALRNLSADSMLALGNTLPFGSFFPVIDGYVVPENMKETFEDRQHRDVPLLAGWVTGDADLSRQEIKSKDDFKSFVNMNYGEQIEAFLKVFPADTDELAENSQRRLAVLNFAAFANHVWATSNTSKSFLYQFSYVPTDKPGFPNYGAFHTSEVPFAYHTLKYWDRPWKESDLKVEEYMSTYWANFIKTGNPNSELLPEWKPYDKTSGNIMELGIEPVIQPGLFKQEFKLLENLF